MTRTLLMTLFVLTGSAQSITVVPNTNHVDMHYYDGIGRNQGGVNGQILPNLVTLSVPTNMCQIQRNVSLTNAEYHSNYTIGPVWENISPLLTNQTSFSFGDLQPACFYRITLR